MQKVIIWRKELSVDHNDLDKQHKQIFSLVNWIAVGIDNNPSGVGAMLDKLIQYTEDHFEYEMSLFRSAGYPESIGHDAEHQEFLDEIQRMRAKLTNSDHLNLENFGRYLRLWIVKHCRSDKQAVAWINKETSPEATSSCP